MALNIKDPETDRLAGEIAELTGESKAKAVKIALAERKARLVAPTVEDRRAAFRRFLEDEIWPQIPESERGVVITKAEREAILGFGSEGV